ncbi:MAG: HU family DNA-binding protein [Muribaculaceae bacterium]|nr:HU family DNA-binding protein [Muribaculaceae bacterium]
MDNKITASALAANMALATGKSRKLCEDFIREFFKLAGENLEAGENLRIKGFGSFKIVDVERRESVNVNTGERYEIAAHRKVVFTPSKEMAETINAPFRDFDSVEIDDEIPDDVLLENEETPLMENESLSEEDSVSNYRLQEGSEEEGADDEITAEAYLSQSPHADDTSPIYEASKEPAEATLPPGNTVPPENPSHEENSSPLNSSEEEITRPFNSSEDEDFYEPEQEPTRFWNGFLIGTLSTFAVCAVIFMLGCFLDWWPLNFGDPKETYALVENNEIAPNPEEETSVIQGEEVQEPEPIYDTVSTTRYLTTIAREHYGDYNFWPYIYEENQSILGHPDRITPGTKVVVPPLSKYGVDPSNPEDVKEAKKKGAEIYARFK